MLTPLQKFGVICAGVFLGLIVLVTVVDLIRGTLPPALALGVFGPAFGGVMTGVLLKAKSEGDRDK